MARLDHRAPEPGQLQRQVRGGRGQEHLRQVPRAALIPPVARAADTPPARLIAHVDMDAFYASVEQLDDPTLKGKPVIVGGIGNRGVVSAASYEARVFGVRSAMPMYEARRRCPQGVYIQVRMSRYKEMSLQVFQVFESFTPTIQGLSLDEAFLDLTGALGSDDPLALGARIKQAIRSSTGLTASVGLAP